ncbi:MAG TPA: carbon monoxide dehydrogenase, partial [Erysipelotrichaceae bacterium]|nr:carbon monoxide dehydrogenase [Erysipelotrichaceae bacterium]
MSTEKHSHRALIGFDKNGVPTVIVPADHHAHTHEDEHGHLYTHIHEAEFTADYMQAVNDYRKTFPKAEEVLEKTPDPAVKEMLVRMKELDMPTAFDRFDSQQPQCSFGLSGVCCNKKRAAE